MCLIGKHPNSYSFSRKALPGFLAYCVRDLVFLGSTFPTGTCCGHQEPLELWSLGVLLLCCHGGHKELSAGRSCLGWGQSPGQPTWITHLLGLPWGTEATLHSYLVHQPGPEAGFISETWILMLSFPYFCLVLEWLCFHCVLIHCSCTILPPARRRTVWKSVFITRHVLLTIPDCVAGQYSQAGWHILGHCTSLHSYHGVFVLHLPRQKIPYLPNYNTASCPGRGRMWLT